MSSDRYDGLTRRQWANRVTDFNPEFDKSLLIKHYTAKQLGKCMEGGNIKLTKALKNKTLPADILTISRMLPPRRRGRDSASVLSRISVLASLPPRRRQSAKSRRGLRSSSA